MFENYGFIISFNMFFKIFWEEVRLVPLRSLIFSTVFKFFQMLGLNGSGCWFNTVQSLITSKNSEDRFKRCCFL